ncbi:Succinate dehydrogenase (Ubiquinone) iron-sulfur protein [Fasciolopsis buskii]|uniref:Succinate dehydrogenase (Ubiquinone) iron-sulfur protein n=1 Tax=Fasciolopsis buskii TaxID=27845 RepID=A0A8E0S3Z1_9TREM|nr:Succinate dehydrogenase (Ubiquinone) iron-sulfur protein [Fasciolopsis buski]
MSDYFVRESRATDFQTVSLQFVDDRLLRAFSTDSMIGFSVMQSHSAPGRAVPAEDARDSDRQTVSSMEGSIAAASTDRNRSLVTSTYMNQESDDHTEHTVLSVPLNGFSGDNISTHEQAGEAAMLGTLEPRNLLADLLEYCSIVMQDVKTPESLNSCHLCFIIVLSITQSPMACSILHDPHITFNVWIHQQRSRRRKSPPDACSSFSSRPIAIAILSGFVHVFLSIYVCMYICSLIVEFVRGHLMKRLPYRLYGLSLSICHNLLCYQIKHKIRLNFDWKQLWSALLSLLQFVRNLDDSYLPVTASFSLIQKVLELFNLCILQGDSFLQSAGVYDDLYYELIRMHELFQSLHEYGERSSVFPLLFPLIYLTNPDASLKAVVLRVVLQMGNIRRLSLFYTTCSLLFGYLFIFSPRSIVNHFKAKIAAFSTANSLTSLTENQVLEVVRDNYDSLTLRVHDDLNVPEIYVEEDDRLLFETLVETVLKQTRKDCMETSLELQSYFHEFSAIF